MNRAFAGSIHLFLLALGLLGCRRADDVRPPIAVGSPLPTLAAAGWLNGEAPSPEALEGHVLVVHAWAHWCQPCAAVFPQLVRLERQYRDQGVRFVGLTAEDVNSLEETRLHLVRSHATWPNGYGAFETLQRFGVTTIPAFFVVAADGRIAWYGTDVGALQQAVETALKASDGAARHLPSSSANAVAS
jgi:thiol-disulfide isomerase/thioredoxin